MSYHEIGLPLHEGHWVYRFWDGEECIYVGVTSGRLVRRIYEHVMGRGGSQAGRIKLLLERATRIDYAEFGTRQLADEEEARQIRRCAPVGNKQGIVYVRPHAMERRRPSSDQQSLV